MKKYTQKALRELVAEKKAEDLTRSGAFTRKYLIETEGHLTQIGYAHGINGLSGALFQGDASGKLYAIIGRCTALFVFC